MFCNLWKRWSDRGVFLRMFEAFADANDTLMIDATHPRRTTPPCP